MAEPSDWIAAEFAELCSRAAPRVRPPGISAAVETVRRRRIRDRAWTAAIAAAVVLAGLLVLPDTRGEPPIDRVTPSPSPAPLASASPEPAEPAAVSPEASTGPTKSSRCIPSVDFQGVKKTPAGANAIDITVIVYKRPSYTTPTCPDARTLVQWVSYSGDWEGNMRLYRSQATYVDTQMRQVQMRIELPGSCGDAWYVVHHDVTLRPFFKWPAGALTYEPYPNRTLDHYERRACTSPLPSSTP